MARLSHSEISQLVDRLTREAADSGVTPDHDAEGLREALASLAVNGDLGPLLGRALAAYLNHPVRCASGAPDQSPGEQTTYAVREAPGLWISLDAALVATIADAMIGGEGDPARIGAVSKATRVARGAAARLLSALASAVGASPPLRVDSEPPAEVLGSPVGGGSMSIGAHEFGWSVGLRRATAASVARGTAAERSGRRSGLSPESAPDLDQRVSLKDALESARAACERSLKAAVAFGTVGSKRQEQPRLPTDCINVGVSAPPGTAILSIDLETAFALLHPIAQGAAGTGAGELGVAGQTGVETIAADVLHAFVDALAGAEPSARHDLRLTGAAILPATPHLAIEHEVKIGEHPGRFRWLVPSDLTESPI